MATSLDGPWRTVEVTGTVTIVFAGGMGTQSFRVEETETGMWPLIDYLPEGMLVRYAYRGREDFFPWCAIQQLNVEPDAG